MIFQLIFTVADIFKIILLVKNCSLLGINKTCIIFDIILSLCRILRHKVDLIADGREIHSINNIKRNLSLLDILIVLEISICKSTVTAVDKTGCDTAGRHRINNLTVGEINGINSGISYLIIILVTLNIALTILIIGLTHRAKLIDCRGRAFGLTGTFGILTGVINILCPCSLQGINTDTDVGV